MWHGIAVDLRVLTPVVVTENVGSRHQGTSICFIFSALLFWDKVGIVLTVGLVVLLSTHFTRKGPSKTIDVQLLKTFCIFFCFIVC